MTGISASSSFRAAFRRRCPSTTSPLLRARTGILNPNSRIDPHIRSTAASFFLGLREYGNKRSIGQSSIPCAAGCVSIHLPSNSDLVRSCGRCAVGAGLLSRTARSIITVLKAIFHGVRGGTLGTTRNRVPAATLAILVLHETRRSGSRELAETIRGPLVPMGSVRLDRRARQSKAVASAHSYQPASHFAGGESSPEFIKLRDSASGVFPADCYAVPQQLDACR